MPASAAKRHGGRSRGQCSPSRRAGMRAGGRWVSRRPQKRGNLISHICSQGAAVTWVQVCARATAPPGTNLLQRLGRVLKDKAASDFERFFAGASKTRERLGVSSQCLQALLGVEIGMHLSERCWRCR